MSRPPLRLRLHPILIVALVAILALIAQIAGSPSVYVYDEHYHLAGARLLVEGMPFPVFLRTPLESAAGPLYPVLHWALAPLTHLAAPAVRWVNPVLLGIMIWALASILRLWRLDRPGLRALMLLAIPTAWVTVGMALTEIPAATAMTLSMLASAWAMTAPDDRRLRIWIGFALAGLLFGIGVLGRQPYLPAIIGFAAVAAVVPKLRWAALLAVACAAAVTVPVFVAWGGLLPPGTAAVGQHIVIEHGALGFAYAAIFVLLLAPRYYAAGWKASLGIAAVGALVSLAMGGLSLQVAAGIARHLPAWLALVFQSVSSMVLVGIGVAFIIASASNAWARRDDPLLVLIIALTVGLAATPAFVAHLFSSRYLMATLPFLLLAVQPYFRPNLWAAARLAVGAAFGLLSLQAYLHG